MDQKAAMGETDAAVARTAGAAVAAVAVSAVAAVAEYFHRHRSLHSAIAAAAPTATARNSPSALLRSLGRQIHNNHPYLPFNYSLIT